MSDQKKEGLTGCPFAEGAEEPNVYGRSDLSYNDYLKVPELLSLQKPLSQPAHHDEMLFIIIHQSYELWFKQLLHEIESVMAHMRDDRVLRAHHHMVRMVEIMRLLVSQIHILETMTPVDFLAFRDHLKPASGFQSLQFRELEFVAGLKDERYYAFFKNRPEVLAKLKERFGNQDLRGAYYALARKQGFAIPDNAAELDRDPSPEARRPIIDALLPVYRDPERNPAFYLFTESLLDFDQQLGLWREHHVRVVERIIGHKRGTGGSSGVDYLQSTTSKKCFPALWELRTCLE